MFNTPQNHAAIDAVSGYAAMGLSTRAPSRLVRSLKTQQALAA